MERVHPAWLLLIALGVGACTRTAEAPPPPPAPVPSATAPTSPPAIAVPLGTPLTPDELERQRFDAAWRTAPSFQVSPPTGPASSAAPAPGPPSTASPAPGGGGSVTFATGRGPAESWTGLDPGALDTLPVRVPVRGDVKGPSVLRAQVRLDRAGFSPGAIDGRWGKNSQVAVYWFQRQNGLAPTGEVDEATYRALDGVAGGPTLERYRVTEEDAKGPFTPIPKDVYEKAKLDCLCHEDVLEALAERFHTTRDFLKQVNPALSTAPAAGQELFVPAVRRPTGEGAPRDVRRIVVSVGGNYLHGLDDAGRILLHAPTTVGSQYDPSPDETLKVTNVAWNPDFRYQPKLFHEVPDTDPEAHLKPGPNSPVGVVWMALSKPHFGIHGTEDPDSIGYASSHGCVRLANWDANDLGRRVEPGIAVAFVDAGRKAPVGGPSPVPSGRPASGPSPKPRPKPMPSATPRP